MKRDKLKELIDREYDGIKVPEGLEDRLCASIDRLAVEEPAKVSTPVEAQTLRNDGPGAAGNVKRIAFRWASIAAAVLLVAGSSVWLASRSERFVEPKDTCESVEEALQETEIALNMIAQAFDKGMVKAEQSTARISESTEKIESNVKLKIK